VAGNAAALGGWILAKIDGISFVTGLDVREDPQFADTLAAALALVAIVGALIVLLPGLSARLSGRRPALVGVSGVAVLALTVPGMVAAGSHEHDEGHEHGEGAAAHEHDHGATDGGEEAAAGGHEHAGHEASAVAPTPYDPTKPIDLSGVEGVTPEQQAAAENLIAITLWRLPRWADYRVAEAAGFHSIGDGLTGYEHFIQWDWINDKDILDPERPESLVYRVDRDGKRTLEAAMYMLPQGNTLDTVPELGGKLTQWHIHDDLCFSPGEAPKVRGLTKAGGECRPGLVKFDPVPMIHVWIVPHECGPFAALEGVGAGQIREGEERLCDHAHGA